ncbi:Cytochrome c oxidase polypeptide II [Roseomonas mucosa]|uniref:Ubiquinol oxidase subunit 2 n=1 Tax=Roseomonas mucosa TaxID=207340 RepID=A0A4Y1MTE1_9PROT|nr:MULTISPECIES: ubiquinol oxidase subunit II [Roseomonas]ATR22336.1 ubiquinol oxidase subunit II [Roseomonas sp. FDAARGOS_362]AWV20843.1 Cytochrome c oxidase polypeptide II [Roseomonas mucosa]MDT8276624.1 ubiquinol oxidase subunit II [Roseomonas mucosa]MDT8356129.1 ubiquinol oxidase subunit II [Roseomonas mucosa]USQ72985.1 ubiquinol oxidase subunit II [Roseomonas mucosa]
MPSKILRTLPLVALAALLSGCKMVVLNPSGDIAVQQRDLIVISTVLMLLIIVPVIVLTLIFAWRYRASNSKAKYDPEWYHSTPLEVVIWAAPLTIIIALGAVTWVGTHLLDPYRPLSRIDAERPVTENMKPLEIQVVSLDWKWLFIYPEQGIATVNEVAAPVDVPINFRITSSALMNSFSIPALAGQIYSMPGMETKLHAVINAPGSYQGFSANYSGAGFSDMHFQFKGMSQEEFGRWVVEAKTSNEDLTRAAYLQLERPSQKEPVRRFRTVDPELFAAILDRCVDTSRMCQSQMMRIDANGGLGPAGTFNVGSRPAASRTGGEVAEARAEDRNAPRQRYVMALCTPADPYGRAQAEIAN